MRFRCRICNAVISAITFVEPFDPRCPDHEPSGDLFEDFPPPLVPEPPDVPALPQPGGEGGLTDPNFP